MLATSDSWLTRSAGRFEMLPLNPVAHLGVRILGTPASRPGR